MSIFPRKAASIWVVSCLGAACLMSRSPVATPSAEVSPDSSRESSGPSVTIARLTADHSDPNPGSLPSTPASGGGATGGPDDPTPAHAGSFPDRAVVFVSRTNIEGGCTGWLYGSGIVATAGHCVNSGRNAALGIPGTWAALDRLWVAPAVVDGPTGVVPAPGVEKCAAERLYSSRGWVEAKDERHDYGAIKLKAGCQLGKQRGWFGFGSSSASVVNRAVHMMGYRKGGQNCLDFGTALMTCDWPGTAKQTTEGQVFYESRETNAGTSGGPIVAADRLTIVMGIHTAMKHGTTPPHSKFNHGTMITQAVFETLSAWRDQP
jgi:V8-like Glu-specific endopeptidase